MLAVFLLQNLNKMTLQDLQDKIQVLYDNDTTTPDSSDDDYKTRTALINTAIDMWHKEEQWRELLTSSNDLTVPIVTVAGASKVVLPTNYDKIAGYIRLSDGTSYKYVPQKDPATAQLYDNSPGENFFYIMGNPKDGYSAMLRPTPTISGLIVKFEYYKLPTHLVVYTDISEIPDAMFCVYYALSKLFDSDGASLKSQKASMEMGSRLDNMVQHNVLSGWFQDTTIPDSDFTNGVRGFGY